MLDYMAFNLPMFASDFIGLSHPVTVLLQRSIYLFVGIAMIFCTILFLRRLPQSQTMRKASVVIVAVSLIASVVTGYLYQDRIAGGKALRTQMRSLEKEMAGYAPLTPLKYDLNVNEL